MDALHIHQVCDHAAEAVRCKSAGRRISDVQLNLSALVADLFDVVELRGDEGVSCVKRVAKSTYLVGGRTFHREERANIRSLNLAEDRHYGIRLLAGSTPLAPSRVPTRPKWGVRIVLKFSVGAGFDERSEVRGSRRVSKLGDGIVKLLEELGHEGLGGHDWEVPMGRVASKSAKSEYTLS